MPPRVPHNAARHNTVCIENDSALKSLRPVFHFSFLQVFLHPGFQNKTDWDNDLALLKLKEPVIISDKVTPIPLPERGQNAGGSGVIAGWGWGITLEPASSLKHLVLRLADHSTCKSFYNGDELAPTVDDNMFCTHAAWQNHNVCFGDSGGALAVKDDAAGDIFAAGILSYDKPCRRDNYAVYMKISEYLPWIHKVMRGDTERSSALRSDTVSKMYLWQA